MTTPWQREEPSEPAPPPPGLDSLAVDGRRVLLRLDLNVPLQEGVVADRTRIEAALPTLQRLLQRDAAVIVLSHLGRPGGGPVEELRLDPVAEALSEALNRPVEKVDDVAGDATRRAANRLAPGEILMLENTRFHPGERDNDPDLARAWASMADAYVNDAFGAAHRRHASTAGLAACLPAAAGLLVQREREALGRLLRDPDRPFVAVLGGAKVSDKLDLMRSLLHRVDAVCVGGGMANTFLQSAGCPMEASLVEEAVLPQAWSLLQRSGSGRADDRDEGGGSGSRLADSVEDGGDKKREAEADAAETAAIHLPADVVAAPDLESGGACRAVDPDHVPAGWSVFDIGPAAQEEIAHLIQQAGTVFWNGPMGVFETPPFDRGTRAVAGAMAEADAYTVVGGGDSARAVLEAGRSGEMGHVSTGGGASLTFLQQGRLPALEALRQAHDDTEAEEGATSQ